MFVCHHNSSETDILYGCHLLRCLYNILYFLWLYNEFFIILYNILKIAELDCCKIIILSILLYYSMFVVILLFGHHHDIAEILLKLALNTIKQTNLSGHQKIWSSEKIKPVAIYKFPRDFTSVSMENFSTIFIIWIKPV
jgi:hypothetical protein